MNVKQIMELIAGHESEQHFATIGGKRYELRSITPQFVGGSPAMEISLGAQIHSIGEEVEGN